MGRAGGRHPGAGRASSGGIGAAGLHAARLGLPSGRTRFTMRRNPYRVGSRSDRVRSRLQVRCVVSAGL
jgi:hypothetical protein